MDQKETQVKIKVVFQDPFNLKNLYKIVYRWLLDHGYLVDTNEADLEILYSEQVRQGDMKEYHIWWRCQKQPPNEYFRYYLSIDYLGLAVKNTEVIKDDKKYKMQIGEITINIKSDLEVEANDKEGKWESHWLLSMFRNWYKEKWYRTKIEQHENTLYEETYKLQSTIKEYLELYQYTTTPDLFFKKKGFE